MRTATYRGKRVNIKSGEAVVAEVGAADFSYLPPQDFDAKYGHIQIFLYSFDSEGHIMDKTGRNAYSLEIDVDGQKIVSIVRIGHCHMCCSGQGFDTELRRYPHRALELSGIQESSRR